MTVAEPIGHPDVDRIIRVYKLTPDELRSFMQARPGDAAAMDAVAYRITCARSSAVELKRYATLEEFEARNR